MTVKACEGCGAASDARLCNMCRSEGVKLPRRPREERRSTTTLCAAPETFDGYEREQARAAAIRAEDPAAWEAAVPLHGARPGECRRVTVGEWLRERRAGT